MMTTTKMMTVTTTMMVVMASAVLLNLIAVIRNEDLLSTCTVMAFTSPTVRRPGLEQQQSFKTMQWTPLKMTIVDDDDDEDSTVGPDDDESPFTMDVVAAIDEQEEEEVVVVVTEKVEKKSKARASDKSWSELLAEAADAAVLLGGAAAKAASEAVEDLEIPTVAIPKSLQAASIKEVAAKAASSATTAASGAIDDITTAASGAVDTASIKEVAAKVASSATGAIDGITTAASGVVDSAGRKPSNVDVSIPYDSAARLAYEEWMVKFEGKIKRPDDNDEGPAYTAEERFQFFEERYRSTTIQNVALKKQLRDAPPVEDGNNTLGIMGLVELDQYADLSPDEYAKVMKSLEPKSWGDIFGDIATLAGTAAASSASKISTTVKDEPKVKVGLSASKKASKPASPFDLFSSSGGKGVTSRSAKLTVTKKKKTTVKGAPAPAKSPSIFGSLLSPKTGSKAPKAKNKAKTTKTASKPPKKKAPTKKASSPTSTSSRPSISIFAPKAKEVESKPVAAPNRSTFSIFGTPKTAATGTGAAKGTPPKKKTTPPSIPTLSNWVQNKDGSITGKVRNSKSFRNGSKITTSPVRRGAKKGSVVKTGSGSQYKLN